MAPALKIHVLERRGPKYKIFPWLSFSKKTQKSHYGSHNEGGVWREKDSQVVNILILYYEQLFTTAHPNEMEEALAHVPYVVSSDMNDSLLHDFTANEVELAIKQMAPSKAL